MAVFFQKVPSKTQLKKFALEWMQAIEQSNFSLAFSMLRQYEDKKLNPKQLQKIIEKARIANDAIAVKLPGVKRFSDTVELNLFEMRAKKSKRSFECVGELIFQFCVDGEIADETIKMHLNQDKDGFSLEFVDMHVW
jgi:hypothetical protein